MRLPVGRGVSQPVPAQTAEGQAPPLTFMGAKGLAVVPAGASSASGMRSCAPVGGFSKTTWPHVNQQGQLVDQQGQLMHASLALILSRAVG